MGLTLQMRKMNPRRLDLVNWWIVVAPVGLVFHFMSAVYLILDLVNIDLVYLKTLARRNIQYFVQSLTLNRVLKLMKINVNKCYFYGLSFNFCKHIKTIHRIFVILRSIIQR